MKVDSAKLKTEVTIKLTISMKKYRYDLQFDKLHTHRSPEKKNFDDESITLNVTKIFYVYHFF